MQNDWYDDSFIEELRKLFKPKLITGLQGISDGYLLKYPDQYLKIYTDDNDPELYHVQYYSYDQMNPLREEHVRYKDLKKLAKAFN